MGYDIRQHIGERTRVHHTFGAYRLPPGLEEGDEVILERFQPGYWTVRNCEGKQFFISMTCVGDAGMLDTPKRPLHPGCRPRVRAPQGPDFRDRK
jgi:hypothetical protein